MSKNEGSTSMGDLFTQRRAARRQQQPPPQEPTSRTRSSNDRPPQRNSFLDIQAQQEREQQQQSQQQQQWRSVGGGRSYASNRNDNYRYNNNRRQQQEERFIQGLPLECGLIASLKESFGFIYCADRPEELFFHYSQLASHQRESLQIDDEVEFRVGPSRNDESKNAAYAVRLLEPGTIVWETEEEPGRRYRGLVQQPPRPSSDRGSSSSSTEGTIRVLEKDEDMNEEQVNQGEAAAATGPLVRFLSHEYTPAEGSGDDGTSRSFRRDRLGRGDLVEFIMITERRTKSKMAKSIVLVQSERERQRLLKEQELLANATLEQGVVTSLKKDFGFLRSNRRREEVYFHYSNVALPDDDQDENNDFVLKEGQEMEFLVVTERKDKVSARQVKFLPEGSVEFHSVVAQGVTGIVTRCPKPVDSSYGEMVGTVRLGKPISISKEADEETTEELVTEVVLRAEDAPGGSYATNRDGSSMGLWIREGDTLLFDVIKEFVDDIYCAAPSECVRPLDDNDSEKQQSNSEQAKDDKTEKAIRLVSLSLAGRAEGVIHAVKDNYGFIGVAERPVDTYFRFSDLLPDTIQADLRRSMETSKDPIQMAVGTEVQFDLSLQGRIPSSSSGHSRSRRGGEKDSLKAQRILLLPPLTIVQTKVLAQDVRGVVTKEDPKQPSAGMIELDEEVKSMTLEELHPLVAKFVDSMLAYTDIGSSGSVIFPELQSVKDDQVVMKMVETRGHGELSCTYIPVASGDSGHPGRLCVTRSNHTESKSDPDNSDGGDVTQSSPELVDEKIESSGADGNNSPPAPPSKSLKKKKKQQKVKSVKLVRYDRHGLSEELKSSLPLGKDDIVLCDVVQARRTGMVSLTNIRVVERKQIERGTMMEEKTSGVGIVSEVVASRQFGFISVHDENAPKRETLFFHTSNVVSDDGTDKGSSSKSRGPPESVIRKGDEVKFDIGIGKNGKPVANNILVVPRGTLNIPTKAEKDACRGYILMEPSHTSLANTPARKASQVQNAAPGTGRWDKVGTEDDSKTRGGSGSSAKEHGSILLLSDPANMFGGKETCKSEEQEEAKKSLADSSEDVGGTESAHTEVPNGTDNESNESGLADAPGLASSAGVLCKRLSYKSGALALHGAGASSLADTSSAPRRGDLVSFVKSKSGKGVRDIRVITRGAATMVRGRLEDIVKVADAGTGEEPDRSTGTATFIASTEKEEEYQIDLDSVVSCNPSILKDLESVEGILHEGKIYGICRTTDLYLESKLGASHKERPRLNLTVRKDLKNRGGKIMAQSMMAKGPDETNGFATGWTKRVSQYTVLSEPEVAIEHEEEHEEPETIPDGAGVEESI